MAEKKIVVQVLADTKPFVASIRRLKKIAETLDSTQIKASNKVLTNLLKNQKINRQIQKIAVKNAKVQSDSFDKAEKSQKRLIKGLALYGATLFAIKKLWGVGVSSYNFGRGVVDPARTYGVNPTQATRANALYSAFGGKAGGGTDILSRFMQNRLDYELYGRGALPQAAGRFRLDQNLLSQKTLPEFIRSLRGTVQKSGFSELATQALLQELGLGGDAAVMRMVTEPQAEFEKDFANFEKMAKSDDKLLSEVEKMGKNVESIWNNIKTKTMDWTTKFGAPVVEKFSKMNPTAQTVTAGILGSAGFVGGSWALSKAFKSIQSLLNVGGKGAWGLGKVGIKSAPKLLKVGGKLAGPAALLLDAMETAEGFRKEGMGFLERGPDSFLEALNPFTSVAREARRDFADIFGPSDNMSKRREIIMNNYITVQQPMNTGNPYSYGQEVGNGIGSSLATNGSM